MTITSDQSFGFLLRRHRRDVGLTQEDLAERAGLSRRTISDLERGRKSTPQAATLELLLSALELSEVDRKTLVAAIPRRRRQGQPAESDLRFTPLPTDLTPLLGREREEAAALHLLRSPAVRLLTLIGPGGVGKTRLAIRVAASWSEECEAGFVPLAATTDPAQLPSAILRSLGVKEGSGPALELLVATLGERELLLLLDNFEQLRGAEMLVSKLISACRRLKLLVTSRTALGIRGEQLLDVPPLETPQPDDHLSAEAALGYSAVNLFVQRTQAVWAAFELTDSRTARVAEACRRLDGLPLAIELATAQLRHMSLDTLIDRLSSTRIGFQGPADAPTRHRTMHETVAWSYDLLSPEAQTLFRALSVFVGSFTARGAEAVADSADVQDRLTTLAASNLIVPLRREEGEARYHMLETVRDFSREAAEALRETQMVRARHALYFRKLAAAACARCREHGPSDVAPTLSDDRENIIAAIDWLRASGSLTDALEIAGSMMEIWSLWGFVRDGRALIDGMLAEAEHQPDLEVPPDAWSCAARFAWIQNDYPRARDLYERAAEGWRKKGNIRGEAAAQNNLGTVAHIQNDYDVAMRYYEHAAALGRQAGSVLAEAMPLGNLATIAMQRGEFSRAEKLSDQAIALYRSIGDRQKLAIMLANRGGMAFRQGKYQEARQIHQEALQMTRELGDRLFMAQSLGGLGLAEMELGRFETAADLLHEALVIFAEAGQRDHLAEGLEAMATIRQRSGDLGAAARLYGGAERLRSEVRYSHHPADLARYRAAVEALRAALGDAEYESAWKVGRLMSEDRLLAEALSTGAAAGAR